VIQIGSLFMEVSTMKKILFALGFVMTSGIAATASAKCYHLENSPSDVYVCVGKNGRDDFADRKKAQDICSAKTGKKCGPVGSSSSSCHSNAGKCYDESGSASNDLKGY
jgi:hypothetical protein